MFSDFFLQNLRLLWSLTLLHRLNEVVDEQSVFRQEIEILVAIMSLDYGANDSIEYLNEVEPYFRGDLSKVFDQIQVPLLKQLPQEFRLQKLLLVEEVRKSFMED